MQSVDLDGRFLYVNRKWREVLGYDGDTLRQLRLATRIHPEHRAAREHAFRDPRSGQDSRRWRVSSLPPADVAWR
ncbi:MAG: PAS domain S-box protein [Polyangiaceae bacterium]|nr:PAS domain S-box protein [Polyangiaceae bacterium]